MMNNIWELGEIHSDKSETILNVGTDKKITISHKVDSQVPVIEIISENPHKYLENKEYSLYNIFEKKWKFCWLLFYI